MHVHRVTPAKRTFEPSAQLPASRDQPSAPTVSVFRSASKSNRVDNYDLPTIDWIVALKRYAGVATYTTGLQIDCNCLLNAFGY